MTISSSKWESLNLKNDSLYIEMDPSGKLIGKYGSYIFMGPTLEE